MRNKNKLFVVTLGLAGLMLTISPCKAQQAKQPAYKKSSLSVDARVKDLLQRMTLDEKIAQMRHIHSEDFDENKLVKFAALNSNNTRLSYGCAENLPLTSVEYATAIYNMQQYMRQNTRLGIPVIPVIEGLHGVVQDGATIYPQSIALAATFNPDLVFTMSDQIGALVKRMGVKQVLSPVLDLARELRWGRVEETYGEDPFLVGEMATAYVKGLRKHNIICTPKHFIGHGSPLSGLNLASVEGGMRQLFNLYLPPFEKVIKYSNPLSIMNCYSAYDGEPVVSSRFMLTDLLRKKMGFKGYVYSDWGSISMLHYFHKTAANAADAARQTVMAGIDLEAGGNDYKLLANMVKNGEINQSYIDSAVSHILYAKIASGLFEDPLPDTTNLISHVHSKESVELAKKLADESAVLLKNNGVLPLQLSQLKNLAVIGPNADQVQFGDYTWSRNNKDGVSPLKGIQDFVKDKIKVNYAPGCDLVSLDKTGFNAAVEAVNASDAAVVFVGSQSASLARDYKNATSGEGFDLSDLKLPGVQEELIQTLKATGKPLVVVLVTGKPFAIPWAKEHADAIIAQWYAGEQEGNSIADILFGKVNPSGKLPVSFPQSVGNLPVYYNYLPTDRGFYKNTGSPEKPGRDYVFASPGALWSFGYGLSYTSFACSNFHASKEVYTIKDTIEVKLTITNTGSRAGKEVVQLYINDKVSSIETPVQQLKAFSKVELNPSETKELVLRVPVTELAIYDRDGNKVVENGEFELRVGNGADHIKWKKVISVGAAGTKKALPINNTNKNTKATNKTKQVMIISGVVRDVQATVLQGVKVSVKGSDVFAVTNENGAYSIKAKEGDTLVFSAKGFAAHTIDVEKTAVLNVKLQPE